MVSQSKGTEQRDNRQVNKVGTVTSGTESELYVLLSLILSPFFSTCVCFAIMWFDEIAVGFA